MMIAASHDKVYNGHPGISTNQKVTNHRPGRLDKLSQHAVANHRPRNLDKLSQHTITGQGS